MKSNYFSFLLLLVFNFGFSSNTLKPLALSATITGGTTVCQNGTQPLVTFTGSGGTAPYTFVYKINGVLQTPAVTAGANTFATVSAPTASIGEFSYELVSVEDSSGVQILTLNPIIIKVIAPFTVSAGGDILVCKGNSINLTSSVAGNGINVVSYSWTGPNGFTSNQQSPTRPNSTILMSGNYTVTATAGSCSVQDVVNVTVLEPTIASAQLQNYNGSEWLVKCTDPGASSGLVFISNGLASNLQSNITSYSVNWGDSGSSIFTTLAS